MGSILPLGIPNGIPLGTPHVQPTVIPPYPLHTLRFELHAVRV